MAFSFPQADRPRIGRGGADWWDTTAGLIANDDYFTSGPAPGNIAAVCLNADGSLTYRLAATGSDRKLYLNAGSLYARLSPIGGDRAVSLSAGSLVA